MKTVILSLLLLTLSSLSAFGDTSQDIPRFSQLHPNVQADVLEEIGVRPLIVADITDLIEGFDGSYVGVFEKEGKRYSFRIHVVFATQGGTSALVTEVKEIEGM